MPTLVLLRHADAVPSKTDDHARPLSPRGRADAIAIGRSLQVTLPSLPLVLASDAHRTEETANLAFSAFPTGVEMRSVAALYGAAPTALVKAIREVPDDRPVLVLVGHNPGISDLARQLVASGSERERARLQAGLPTAGAAVYDIDGSWAAVGPQTGRLRAVLVPGNPS